MKLFNNILKVVLLSAVLIFSATLAHAQEKKYKVNKLWENVFVNAGAGASMLTEDNQGFFNGKVKGNFDVSVGKWFSPWFGLRIGYQGGILSEYVKENRSRLTTPVVFKGMNVYEASIRYGYTHADFLWNFSNTVAGYTRDRSFDFIPYINMGVFHSYHMDGQTFKREFAAGLGVINSIRLSDAFRMFLDLRATFVNGRNLKRPYTGGAFTATANAGLTYNIGKSWWTADVGRRNDLTLVHNPFFDNMFLSAMGGVSVLTEGNQVKGGNGNVTGSFDASLGKWFSPYFGGRIGYQGGMLSEWIKEARHGMSNIAAIYKDEPMYLSKMDYSYLHADILWDVLNTFVVKDNRPLGVALYAHMGYLNIRPTGQEFDKNGIGGGLGLYTNIKLIDKLDFVIDARAMVLKGESVGKDRSSAFAGTAFAGLAYKIGRQTFPQSKMFENVYEERVPTGPRPHVAGRMKDNWFLTVSGGGTLLWETGSDLGAAGVTPALDLTFGKWVTPWTAIRIGYQGYNMKTRSYDHRAALSPSIKTNKHGKSYYINSLNYGYVHADFLWDALNTFSYDRYRVWSLIPYTHMGVMRAFLQSGASYNREYVLGAGIINSFQVGPRASLFVDLRTTFIHNDLIRRKAPGSAISANALLGVEIDLGKVNFWKSHADTTTTTQPVLGRWKDNIFVSVGGGANLLYEDGFSFGPNLRPAAAFDIAIGKWFSPDFGVRLGYQGGGISEWLDNPREVLAVNTGDLHGVEKYILEARSDYFHADVLWDMTNLIYPRAYNRIWSLIPYYHTGFYNVKTTERKLYSDGYAAGFGLINDLQVTPELSFYVDLRATILNGRNLGRGREFGYKGSVLAGLAYHIGGARNWIPASQFRLTGYQTALNKKLPTGPAPLLDNKFFDNIFLSLGGGVNMLTEDHISRAGFTPVVDLNIGKWITPSFGLRLGIQGMEMSELVRNDRGNLTPTHFVRGEETLYKVEMKYHYTHLDFLWNMNDSFTSYDANRFWSIIPYSQFGVFHSYYKDGATYKREYAVGAGLINSFRLSNRLKAFLDLKATFLRARTPKINTPYSNGALATSALLGVSYDFGKNYWTSYKDAPDSYEYVLNPFKDNWFVGIAGGGTLLTEGNMKVGFNGDVSWTFDATVGKWFSPQFGARLGYQRGILSEWVDHHRPDMGTVPGIFKGEKMYANEFSFGYFHADFMWDMLNSIIGYDEYRAYHLIPYVHSGFFATYAKETKNELATGIGILNNFAISPKFNLFADLRATVLKSNSVGKNVGSSFAGSLMAGISYNLGNSSFRTSKRVSVMEAAGLDKKDKEGVKTGLPPFVANRIFDNLFVSVGGGVNLLGEGKSKTEVGTRFGLDINFGKWYSPYFGNRIGIMGTELNAMVKEVRHRLTGEPDQFGNYSFESKFYYAHADFLWNATNTIGGYKRERVWNVSPYGHFGVAQGFYMDGTTYKREYAYGIGLLNSVKLLDRASIFADVRVTTMSGRFVRNPNVLPFITTVLFGVNYDVTSKNYWHSYEEASEGQYLSKNFKQGYFFSLAGGVNIAAEGGQSFGHNAGLTSDMEISFGRWFSPHFGGRVGLQTGALSQLYDTARLGITTTTVQHKGQEVFKSKESFAYLHGDLLWNLSNTFFGINPERVVDIVPYAHTGFIRADRITGEKLSNGLAAGLGVLANFRIDNEFGLFLDGRTYCYKSNTFGKSKGFAFGTAANLGMTYNFGGDNWKKATEYVPDGKKERFEKDYRSFAISTNALTWFALGTINVGAQYEVSRHFTLEGKVKYNPWTFNRGVEGQFQMNQQSFAFGARYWPWYSFAGWWIGANAQFKNYRTGGLPWMKGSEEGTCYGAGLSLGYSVLITKWFNLDFGIGGWGGYKTYTEYENSQFKNSIGNGQKWFFAPDDVSVSAVFIF